MRAKASKGIGVWSVRGSGFEWRAPCWGEVPASPVWGTRSLASDFLPGFRSKKRTVSGCVQFSVWKTKALSPGFATRGLGFCPRRSSPPASRLRSRAARRPPTNGRKRPAELRLQGKAKAKSGCAQSASRSDRNTQSVSIRGVGRPAMCFRATAGCAGDTASPLSGEKRRKAGGEGSPSCRVAFRARRALWLNSQNRLCDTAERVPPRGSRSCWGVAFMHGDQRLWHCLLWKIPREFLRDAFTRCEHKTALYSRCLF